MLTAYKISGYPSSSGTKKAIDVFINIRILVYSDLGIWHEVYNFHPESSNKTYWFDWIRYS
jgi:hypothetical protein